MSYSNEKNITIQTEDRLDKGLIVGLSWDSTSEEYDGWEVCNGETTLPMGVTVGQSSGANVDGTYNTAVQILSSGDAVKQFALAPDAEVKLGGVIFTDEDGYVNGEDTGLPIGLSLANVDNSDNDEPVLFPAVSCIVATLLSILDDDDDDGS